MEVTSAYVDTTFEHVLYGDFNSRWKGMVPITISSSSQNMFMFPIDLYLLYALGVSFLSGRLFHGKTGLFLHILIPLTTFRIERLQVSPTGSFFYPGMPLIEKIQAQHSNESVVALIHIIL